MSRKYTTLSMLTTSLILMIISACETGNAILDTNSVNQFLASDMPNAAGMWWQYEISNGVYPQGSGVQLKRKILPSSAQATLMEETYLQADTLVLEIDTAYVRLNNASFAVNVDGQWKELLRFPAYAGLSWNTDDGDLLTVESTRESVSLPVGDFFNCVKVTSRDEHLAYYYTYGLGLILVNDITTPIDFRFRLNASSEIPQ